MSDEYYEEGGSGILKKILIGFLLFLLSVLLIAGGALAYLYFAVISGDRFLAGTTVNGYNIGNKTVEEAAKGFLDRYNSRTLTITEDNEVVLKRSFSEIGYEMDSDKLKADLQSILDEKEADPFGTYFSKEQKHKINLIINYSDTDFRYAVCSEFLTKERVSPEDAYITYTLDGAVITPEKYGTTFENKDLQEIVKEQVTSCLNKGGEDSVSVEIPEYIYITPDITQDNEDLLAKQERYQKLIDLEITYTFGNENKVLGWSEIQNMTYMDGDTICIDNDAIYEYVVYSLGAVYNTIYLDRSFKTHDGRIITLPSNDYGYRIDENLEADQLKSDILGLESVEREPVYEIKGYKRNGTDDLAGCYVEVSLADQHLWFYIDGQIVVETDVVSGCVANGTETTDGAFPIPYKISPYNLTGGGGEGGSSWDVTVQYWMPFFDGQGLHDASWRGSFGGSIYQTSGSHGCVNLPVDKAGEIFNYMEEGMPIILYK